MLDTLTRAINFFRKRQTALNTHLSKMSDDKWRPGGERRVELLNFAQHQRDAEHDKFSRSPEGFSGRIQQALQADVDLQIIVNSDFPDYIDFSSIRGRIVSLEINVKRERTFTFQNADLLQIHVVGKRPNLILKNCHVGKLKIEADADCYLDLEGSWVSSLSVGKSGIRHWAMRDGGLLSITPTPADGGNPFTGPVTIENVYLPREGSTQNAQRLRDTRTHLLGLNNVLAAGKFHSAELALDRPIDSLPNRVFSWFYEAMADFGNSTVRPIISLILFISLMTALGFFSDAIEPADTKDAPGWREHLIGEGCKTRILRSATYAVSTILNPLGILQSKPILVSTTPLWAFILAIVGLGGTLSIVFLVIAIRRRFKLE